LRYDIIGDIHGHANKLEGLLLKLGYGMKDGIYQQKDHQSVFVGDFIDRGTQNCRVLEIVRNMIDSRNAYAVMGNHEYNSICYHTRKPGSKNDYLRPHTQSNFRQHENFLKEYPLGHPNTEEIISWFKTLPLFIEFDAFRIIHACWDSETIKQLKPYLNDDNTLKEEYFPESANKDSHLFDIVERLLKGVEVELPESCSFKDKDGKERNHVRVKWWGTIGENYGDIAFGYDDAILEKFAAIHIHNLSDIPFYHEDKPVFFGHYWMTGPPMLQQDNLCCVDYSAGKGRKLVCYTFDNPHDENLKLHRKHFSSHNE